MKVKTLKKHRHPFNAPNDRAIGEEYELEDNLVVLMQAHGYIIPSSQSTYPPPDPAKRYRRRDLRAEK
jgi:hypothetical protein